MLNKNDRLALFGYGIFETLKVNQGVIEVPWLHYQRMGKGAEKLGLTIPHYDPWLISLKKIVEKSKKESFALRVTLSGGSGDGVPSQWLYHTRPIPYTENDYTEGIPIVINRYPRNENSPLMQIKSTNYMENILAKREAEEKGAREGIWLNTKGYLAEGTMSNLFFVKEGIIYTPSLGCGCLSGTRRQLVLECARKVGLSCVEGEFPWEFMENAEEVFLTNALMGIMPVCRVNGRKVPLENTVSKALKLQFNKLLLISST